MLSLVTINCCSSCHKESTTTNWYNFTKIKAILYGVGVTYVMAIDYIQCITGS